MSQGCGKLGMEGASSRPAICWPCDLEQAELEEGRRYCTVVSSELNPVKFSPLAYYPVLFYPFTFHITSDLVYLFTCLSVSLIKKEAS